MAIPKPYNLTQSRSQWVGFWVGGKKYQNPVFLNFYQ
uniref:Uncharacterized protein n=1 Tax=Rhizophora mucronata TaxID=61149 RepID=A0A2P2Q231_RHIMU